MVCVRRSWSAFVLPIMEFAVKWWWWWWFLSINIEIPGAKESVLSNWIACIVLKAVGMFVCGMCMCVFIWYYYRCSELLIAFSIITRCRHIASLSLFHDFISHFVIVFIFTSYKTINISMSVCKVSRKTAGEFTGRLVGRACSYYRVLFVFWLTRCVPLNDLWLWWWWWSCENRLLYTILFIFFPAICWHFVFVLRAILSVSLRLLHHLLSSIFSLSSD